jgi:hypothetical protein
MSRIVPFRPRPRSAWRRLLDLVRPVTSAPKSGGATPVITLVPIAPRRGDPVASDAAAARRRRAA